MTESVTLGLWKSRFSARAGGTVRRVACPCGVGVDYESCCRPFHDKGSAPTAVELMRSRYTAFAMQDAEFLLATWHPDTRPSQVTFSPEQEWTALEIFDTAGGTMFDDEGTVRFAASFSSPAGNKRLLEVSQFARIDGKWRYVVATEATVVDD